MTLEEKKFKFNRLCRSILKCKLKQGYGDVLGPTPTYPTHALSMNHFTSNRNRSGRRGI
jgi:hypothetical protein